MRKTTHMFRVATYALPLAALVWAGALRAAGPYNVETIAAAPPWTRPVTLPDGDWSLTFWSDIRPVSSGPVLRLAAVAGAADELMIAMQGGRPTLAIAGRRQEGKPLPRRAGESWHHYALIGSAGVARLYVDGQLFAQLPHALQAGPKTLTIDGVAGRFADLRLRPGLSLAELRAESAAVPQPGLIPFEQASPHWLLQTHQMQGQTVPQDAATLPRSQTAPDRPVAKPLPSRPALAAAGDMSWIVGAWTLAEAPTIAAGGAELSRPGYRGAGLWYPATVPGTVLTTLVDRGVYPDPAHGLNNLAIPEKLARQDYWYRTEFDLPAGTNGRRLELLLNGVNYSSAVWVNGTQVGTTKGAFARGRFDVTARLRAGRNAIAIRVSPPPHAGHTQEESLTSGVGENGGEMMLDGPTFGATEGWDWIPTIRDRNSGLWQDVRLVASGDVRIGDAQVVTTLPRADNSIANVEIDIPVTNLADHAVTATVRAAFDDVQVERTVEVAAGGTAQLRFSPDSDPALAVHNPRLWWPNGYGEPALHELHLTASVANAPSDSKDVRFGMRQVTYELSLVDGAGALDRVAVDLGKARSLGQQIVDERHEAIRQVPGGWAYSFAPGAEASPAVTAIKGDEGLSPFLVLRVNGVRIAARGGSIGMDDFMKRVDRAHLEPYFRLHQDAHVNIIRNWIGQSTEETFFDLADEYGLMVLNDFWESTQDYNIEAQDVPLFLDNAREVVQRFRNHPSIVVWFGRNEGVPQPILNEGLADLIRRDDGTRLYMGSSNRISLHDSGPYNWRPPEKYFTDYSKGFAVEVGTPSFPTLEAWERAIPASERWPISDSWAYHDWHQTGNGAVSSFTAAMDREFGKATSLPDFERKAQMLEYESYRAIFEGMNAGLWTTNSGRMLWMTQPAWPSSAWQIFSSDYDTHGAFYGMKKASEPVHVQMNLPDHKIILVNNRREALSGVRVHARVQGLDGQTLASRDARIDAAAGEAKEALTLDLDPVMAARPVLVRLEATDADGVRLSDNFYWQAKDDAALQSLAAMAPVTLTATARQSAGPGERRIDVTLANPARTAAIQAKLGLFDPDGTQILPAYFSDNYVSLLPGETRTVTITAPADHVPGAPVVRLRGWNVAPATIPVPAL